MKADEHTGDAQNRINPFIKLANDMERIADAVKNGQPLSSLTDIKFVRPFDLTEDEVFIAEYNKELDESEAQIDAGDYYTQDEVKKILDDRRKNISNK